ncbi:unnamed protein product [Prunus armeniaca]
MVHAESSHLDGDQVATVSDGVSDLQDLRRRIQAIENGMVEKERHFSANQVQKVDAVPTDHCHTEAVKEHKNKYSPSESLVEKELGMDKLEISKRFTEPRQEGNKRRILERLDSDVQKLTNLQITVEDLKRKVNTIEKSKKGKGIEFENMKGQLEEADEAITKLFDVNKKLMKNVEDGPLFSDGASGVVSDESGSVRRRASKRRV